VKEDVNDQADQEDAEVQRQVQVIETFLNLDRLVLGLNKLQSDAFELFLKSRNDGG